uniref:HAT C-terminal dimerisation domain-containing protein n=1 Tax=Oryza brachyantha TaxID=4533 RepID=J3NCI3_ORYBR
MDPHAAAPDGEDDEHETTTIRAAPSACSASYSGGCAKAWRKTKPRHRHADESATVDFSGGPVIPWSYDECDCRDELAAFVASHDLPVGIAGTRSFEAMVRRAFCPQYEGIDRVLTMNDISVAYDERAELLREEFSDGGFSFALSSSIWATSYHGMSYLSVSAHYLDEDYSLNKRVIGFRLIDSAPTAQRILDVARQYNIDNRVVSVTLGDGIANAETMTALAPLLRSYTGGFVFQQSCIFNILSDIVQAGMAEMAEPLGTIRTAIAYAFSSEVNFAAFGKYCDEHDPRMKLLGLEKALKFLGEALNVDYSSTYSQVADEFHQVLSMYEEKFGSTLRPPPSSPEWWKNNRQFFIVLAQLARDILAAPVSTVSSAEAFNINGREVEDQRSCLAPEMVEAITCLKDWEHATYGDQHRMVNAEFASELGLNM